MTPGRTKFLKSWLDRSLIFCYTPGMNITHLLSGFRKVTKEEFFAWVGNKNIHPSLRNVLSSDPCAGSDWKVNQTDRVVGRDVMVSHAGYPHWKPDTDYYLLESV